MGGAMFCDRRITLAMINMDAVTCVGDTRRKVVTSGQ